jgi:hypothetical protein
MLKNNHTYESEGVTKPQDPTAVESNDHLTFNGLPINTQGFAPLMLLIPSITSQHRHRSVSFIQILNLLNKLQVVSYFKRKETVEEFHKSYKQERLKQDRIL